MQEQFGKLEQFFSQFRQIHYKKHALLMRADDIPSGVYYLYKGYARYYSLSEAGQELSYIIVKPQDIFPVIWAITDSSNTQYCEAMTDIEVSRAPKDEFVEFLRKNPDLLYEVFRKMLVRFEGVLDRMAYMVFGNAYQKVASILVICAERFGIKKGDKIIIRVPLTHQDIANLIGLTRETTSVEIKKLEKLKIYSKKGSFISVRNLEKLKKEAKWSKFV